MDKSFAEISEWLRERVAHHAEVSPEEVTLDTDIVTFRMDSLLMVNVTSELEEWLGIELSPSLFWEKRTIAATTQWIIENQEV